MLSVSELAVASAKEWQLGPPAAVAKVRALAIALAARFWLVAAPADAGAIMPDSRSGQGSMWELQGR